MDWLALSLACAFLLASADAFTKKWLSDYTAAELVLVRFGLTALLFVPWLIANPPPPVPPAFWGWVAAALPLEIVAMTMYMAAIRRSPLALTLPYLAFTPVFAAGIGWLLLGERITPLGLAGVLLVTIGAYALNAGETAAQGRRDWLAPLRAIAREPGSRLMLGVALIYSMTSVLGKGALQYMPAQSFGPLYFGLLGGVVAAGFALRAPAGLAALWRRPAANFAIAGLVALMALTHFLAIERIEVATMIAVKRTSLLFGILYGASLFREAGLRRHLAAGALMVAGVAVLTLP